MTNVTGDAMANYFLGIDPGSSGGLAHVHDLADAGAVAMPDTDRDAWGWFCRWREYPVIAAIEKVGGFMGGGGKNLASAHTMFAFGRSYGLLLGLLVASEISYVEVPPGTWQRGLGVPPKKKSETRVAWKNRLKSVAQARFPRLKVTLATADALLIALYCKQEYGGGDKGRGERSS